MMLSNSAGFAQPAERAHAELIHLPRRRRRLSEAAGRDLHVLLAQRVDDVAGGEPRAARRSGSSQSRIEYLRSPKIVTSPTPGTRFSASLT